VTKRVRDAVVVGGGPAGLGFAIAAARRGLDVLVLERRTGPLDKACGEGVLPQGVRALEDLGVLTRVPAADRRALSAIRWIDPGGAQARLALPPPGGVAVRRTALSSALLARAREEGAEIVQGAAVVAHRRGRDRIVAEGPFGAAAARVLVAADGLGSPTRRREGLDLPPSSPRRFGIRRHFAVAPWTDEVEVHFGERAEAYVWPSGPLRVGVAFLFEQGSVRGHAGLLDRFPAVARRIGDAPEVSQARGAGPLARAARARVADRLVLLGDAAGYLDAITGEGLALSLGCALDLARILPDALVRGASATALAPYEGAWRRRFRPYAAWTRTLLVLSRAPALRRTVLALAAFRPGPFERVVAAAVG
jgi:flavin-dependent dehydrogenase